MGGRGSSSGKAGSNEKQVNSMMSRIVEPTGKQSTTQEEKIQAVQQPKSTATKQNTADIAQRKKNASAFDNVTSAKLDKMTLSQLKKLARKAYLYKVGKNSWDPQTESEALSRFDSLGDYQSKSALKKIIMSGKKEAKNYK
jgi:hypothetical protein